MAKIELSFAASIEHELGKEAYQFRVNRKEWRAVNVATLGWKRGSAWYTFTAVSDPITGEHSEEQLLSLFDEITLEEDDAITDMQIYTELEPCYYTKRPHVMGASHPVVQKMDIPLLNKVTVTHKGCKHILAARFPDLPVYFTVKSIDTLRKYIALQASCAKLGVMSGLILGFVRDQLSGTATQWKLLYRCPASHLSSRMVGKGLREVDLAGLRTAACGCGASAALCGQQKA